jgi:hypothetical protein
MKAIAVLLLIVAIVLVVAIAVGVVQRKFEASRLQRAARSPWRYDEVPEGNQVSFYLIKGSEPRQLLGSIPTAAEDFEMLLYQLRAEADERVLALNDPNRVLGP